MDVVFRKIDKVTRFLRVNDACKRVEKMVKDIEKVAGKIDDRWKQASAPRSYAHVTRVGNTGVVLGAGVETPPTARPRDERRIVVRIASKEEAEALREQTREDIVSRIQLTADEAHANHKVVAIQKLKSGDIAVHMDSSAAKKDLEAETSWVRNVTLGATVRKRI